MKKLVLLSALAVIFTGSNAMMAQGGTTPAPTKGEKITKETKAIEATPSPVLAPAPVAAPVTEAPAVVEIPTTTVTFSEMVYDFGEILDGEVVSHKYTVTNTGKNDLFIENVKPSCGCTTPDWTREAIAPGKTGFIEAKFDSRGKIGSQMKSITVTANTEPRITVLSFKGEVVAGKPDGTETAPEHE